MCIRDSTTPYYFSNYAVVSKNENNLNLFEESSQSYLKQQMEIYFFSEEDVVDKIEGYTPK